MEQNEYRERLARDAARWRIDGIISDEQERAILARAGAGAAAGVRALRMGWLITAVSVIGALVLGAGVVLFFASNWEAIPDNARMALLIAGLVAVYSAGYVLMERLDMQRLGSAMLLLGVVLFQAALFLVAQIYNMPVESPVLFLLGAIGALPLAYLFGSRIVLLLAIAAITTWRIWAAELSYDSGAEEWATLVLAGAFGVLLYAAGRLHMVRSGALARLGEVYVFAGALLTLAIVFMATFIDVWDEVIDYAGVEAYSAPSSVYVAIGIASAAVVAQLLLRARSSLALADIGAQAGLLVLAAVVATWPAWDGYALVFNGVFFALAGGIVLYGYLNSDERYINAGLVALGTGLVARYCDTFWSLLAGSAFFIGGGIVLLALAFILERTRRRILDEMKEPDDSSVLPPREALA
jgi:uncharacterized membrane protein